MWGVIKEECPEYSFIVNCANGNFRRTCSYLVKLLPCESKEQSDDHGCEAKEEERPLVTRESSGEAAEAIPESTKIKPEASLHEEATTPRRGTPS